MIFEHTWQAVLEGRKTQTRRLASLEDDYPHYAPDGSIDVVYNANYKRKNILSAKYAVGKTYAVQVGRGKPAIARIRLIDIRREDVREMYSDDWIAEGFQDQGEFMEIWCKMHDATFYKSYQKILEGNRRYDVQMIAWQMFIEQTQQRPIEFYDAWALEFELVR